MHWIGGYRSKSPGADCKKGDHQRCYPSEPQYPQTGDDNVQGRKNTYQGREMEIAPIRGSNSSSRKKYLNGYFTSYLYYRSINRKKIQKLDSDLKDLQIRSDGMQDKIIKLKIELEEKQ